MFVRLKRRLRKLISPIRRRGLKNTDFTIISNNCWAGVVYDILGMKYNTPTIGCYFSSCDYVKFCSNLKYYLSLDLIQEKDDKKIVGRLDDIKINFVHYKSFEEAYEKWNRRKVRINFDNMIVKYSDQNEFNDNDYEVFSKLEYKKIFITSNLKYKECKNTIFIKKYEKQGYAVDDIKPSLKKINIVKFINEIESGE